MAYPRHRSPARHRAPAFSSFRRLGAARRVDAVIGIAGAGVLALAAIGALADASPGGVAAEADGAGVTVQAMLEIDQVKALRQDALQQAARGTDRWLADVRPPWSAPATGQPAEAVAVAPLPATTKAYTTQGVNVRAAASKDAPLLAELDFGAELAVTGRTAAGYAEIVHEGRLAWVYAEYVSATRPAAEAKQTPPAGGVSGVPCSSGSGVESGLAANGVAVHRALCALFPGVSAYGGLRPGDSGEHGSGHALDVMVSTDLGNQIVAYLQAHVGELGIRELIWQQRIWSTERAGDGWRWMEDRGSATANHYDHVHVTVR